MPKTWIDENGLEIPISRITKTEKLRERRASKLMKKATSLSEKLAAFKEETNDICQEIFEAVMAEHKTEIARKGNFIWYNFDRSIKIEVDIQDRISFDDTLIEVAKQKFESFLKGATNGVDEMIRTVIMDAFSTRRGRLDPKRVLNLLQHRQRVDSKKYPLFHEAASLIEQSMRRTQSRQYVRFWQKDGSGEYQSVNLNFSSI